MGGAGARRLEARPVVVVGTVSAPGFAVPPSEIGAYGGTGVSAPVLLGARWRHRLGERARTASARLPRAGRALHRAGLVPEAQMERLRRKYGSEDYRRSEPDHAGVCWSSPCPDGTGRVHGLRSCSWASAGVARTYIGTIPQSRAGCQSALEVPPAIVPETTASVRINRGPWGGHLMTPPGRRSAGRPGPRTKRGRAIHDVVNGLVSGLGAVALALGCVRWLRVATGALPGRDDGAFSPALVAASGVKSLRPAQQEP